VSVQYNFYLKRYQCLIMKLVKSHTSITYTRIRVKFWRNISKPLDNRYRAHSEIVIPEWRLLDKHSRDLDSRFSRSSRWYVGPHERPSLTDDTITALRLVTRHSRTEARITNWGPNRGRLAPWLLYLSVLLSAYISLCPRLDIWPFDSELVGGVSNLQRRNTPLHRQGASWSVCFGYVPRIRKKIRWEKINEGEFREKGKEK